MSGEKITARLRTECDLNNGKERIQVYCVDIRVSTTSYGTLSLDKMERFMQEMQEGVDTAKYIGETFIKPMVEGKWNWEVTV